LVELSVIHGLEQGNEVLKEIHKEMNIETVEKLLEESQEARDYQKVRPLLHGAFVQDVILYSQEVGEMLSNKLTLDEEDAVQAELRELQVNIVSLFVCLVRSILTSS